jgi:hypothetical protein
MLFSTKIVCNCLFVNSKSLTQIVRGVKIIATLFASEIVITRDRSAQVFYPRVQSSHSAFW